MRFVEKVDASVYQLVVIDKERPVIERADHPRGESCWECNRRKKISPRGAARNLAIPV